MTDMHYKNHALGTCAYCGKKVYASRKQARTAYKKIFGKQESAKNMTAYECREALRAGITGLYHFGHIRKMVVNGDAGRIRRPTAV